MGLALRSSPVPDGEVKAFVELHCLGKVGSDSD